MNDECARDALPEIGSPEFFRGIVDTAATPFVVVDQDLTLRYVSPSIELLLGFHPEDWLGQSVADLLSPESLEVALAGLVEIGHLTDDPNWVGAPVRVFIKNAEGRLLPVDALARDSTRTGVPGIVVQLHRAAASQTMSDAVDAILDGTDPAEALGLLISLIKHDITKTHAMLGSNWDGLAFGQVVGDHGLLDLTDPLPDDRTAIHHCLLGRAGVTDIFDALAPETRAATRAMGMHACWCAPVRTSETPEATAALLVWHSEPGHPGAIYRSDIARSVNLARLALRWTEQQRVLSWEAAHDRLTGLTNRSEFQHHLEHGSRSPRAVLFCDLDDFKPVNDRFGHRVGDQVLVAVAGRLRNTAHPHVVARLGGDEFGVLVDPAADLAMVDDLAEAIRDTLNRPIEALGHLARVGVCIGVAFDPSGDAGSDELLDEADRMLRIGKRAGKNSVHSVTLPH